MIHMPVLPGINTVGGNGMRRSLQYDSSTPRLDIMVRESIQNSFDALKDEAEYLEVSYRFDKFSTSELASHFTSISEVLNSRFGERSDYVEIRDTNTVGLDGPLESMNISEYGKLIKLVYSIAEKQEGLEKGGSWGYGKTNFYNIGIGLVIYYTHTIYMDSHQHRLVAALVEDTDHREDMIYEDAQLGVSYWGDKGILDPTRAIPITDLPEIKKILNVFGINPFPDEQTGTSIIIPFIDKDLLLKEMGSSIFQIEDECLGLDDFQFFVELAVQRWYFPRLLNMKNGKPLRFLYNGQLLTESRILPMFKIMRDVYNETFETSNVIELSSLALLEKDTPVAYYASYKGKLSELSLPYNMSVYQALQIPHNPSRPNTPIGFRCRSLGMINKYETEEGIVKGATPCNPDEFHFVCLRPRGEVEIINPNTKVKIASLEMYIRKGENAAHTNWSDISLYTISHDAPDTRPQIVQRMTSLTAECFSFKEPIDAHIARRNLGLSQKIGKLFLPKQGFGTRPVSSTPHGGDSGGSSHKPKAGIGKTSITRHNSDVIADVTLNLNDGKSVHMLSLSPPESEIRGLDSIQVWEEECGMRMPVSIRSFEIVSIGSDILDEPVIVESHTPVYCGQSVMEPICHDNRMFALRIIHALSITTIQIRISMNCGDCPFRFGINVKAGD